MLMVVFGAGASYDSDPSRRPSDHPPLPNRPPLATELFQNRAPFAGAIQLYPRCQAVIPRLRHPRNETVESVLQHMQDEAAEYPVRHRQLAAVRYYLQTILSQCAAHWLAEATGVTNYKTLLDQIERWRKRSECVGLVTFNYDTLLEAALPDVGLDFSGLADYVKHPHYKVIKLHGSVNWSREVETAPSIPRPTPGELIESAADLKISERYVMTPSAQAQAKVLFPAIAIPVESKSTFECPPEHLEVLGDLLPKVTKLLVIGWRATEDHFLELLKEKLPRRLRVMVVAGSQTSAEEPIKRLRAKLDPAGFDAAYHRPFGGFTEFILSSEVDGFLQL